MELPLFQRDITSKILNRTKEDRRFIQVIAGPRQVGKTTAILQVLKQIECSSHYAAADLPAPPHDSWISQQWESARSRLSTSQKVILVLDEVQKVSHWSETVKRLWDEDTRFGNNIHVLILGSSALLIHKGLSESLAGRFEVIRCSHWAFTECRDCFQETSWCLAPLSLKGDQLLAVEVKSGEREDHLDGLKLFLKENKNAKSLVVGSGGVDLKTFLETSVLYWFD